VSNEVIQKFFHVSSCTLCLVDNNALTLIVVLLEAHQHELGLELFCIYLAAEEDECRVIFRILVS
jgi:hypothetical protein